MNKNEIAILLSIPEERIIFNENNNCWDIYFDVRLNNSIVDDCEKLKFKLGKIYGNCSIDSDFIYLDLIPSYVGLSFIAINNPTINNLKYLPRYIGGNLYCYGCDINIINNLPIYIGGEYINFANNNITEINNKNLDIIFKNKIINLSTNELTKLDVKLDVYSLNLSHNNISYISSEVKYEHINLYKNPCIYFKKYGYDI